MICYSSWKKARKAAIIILLLNLALFLLNIILIIVENISAEAGLLGVFSFYSIFIIILLVILIINKPYKYLFDQNEIIIFKGKMIIKALKPSEIEYFRYTRNFVRFKEKDFCKIYKMKLSQEKIAELKDIFPEVEFREAALFTEQRNRTKKKHNKLYMGIAIFSTLVSGAIIIGSFALVFTGSWGGKYTGNHPELYTEAINSLVGAAGYSNNGEASYNSSIKVIEEDDLGRKLFSYNEGRRTRGYSLLISQASTEEFVYYIPDYNFISRDFLNDTYEYEKYFSESAISAFKSKNHWNEEVDLNICIKKEIVRKKSKPEIKIPEKNFETLLDKYAKDTGYKGDDSLYRYSIYAISDDYSRSLYYVVGVGYDAEGKGVSPNSVNRDFRMLMIFHSDKSYSLYTSAIPLPDLNDYNDLLKDFKEANKWNLPY